MIGHGDIQAEISARLDGESGTIPDDVLAAHLDSCEQCGEFFSRAVRLQDELGPSDAPAEEAPAPDFSDAVLAQAGGELSRRAGRRLIGLVVARILLILTAAAHVWWGVGLLRQTTGIAPVDPGGGPLPPGADPELSNQLVHGAAVSFAVALSLLLGAAWPRWLIGFVPFLGALSLFTVGFFLRDVVVGAADSSQCAYLGLLLFTAVLAAATWAGQDGFGRWRAGLRALGARGVG
ncbi:zf-HC2 domain-containing protein [Corynebacterium otitidis]|uniref:Putative membrane protein n=1 Tax=Corynebacterium otitidis ATCC 51513 TaxID=883169 RepID=I7L7Y3_9CORY|nr:zf-HC2 domain-containing protein [Corynebacterium otitidis]EJZ82651.1 hypothetical protein HMPREF9719_00419 [Corynebacterium otitidis ATCC 51513]KKO83338.1 membrane protein [Corynebacterium otitidis]CCI82887.1 putative membrane protein [Corynebacterium otitidis ATCC 51513]